jgi:ketol-acid reductoisomerase
VTTLPNVAGPRLFYDSDADLARLRGRRIAVIGFGSQGHAHALNLRDSGLDVVVGLRRESARWDTALAAGLQVATVADAARGAELIMILAPDQAHGPIFDHEIRPGLASGSSVLFAHGFSIRFGQVTPPTGVDVSLIAPKSPGHRVREVFVAGGGVPALVAVERDASGSALADALAYAKGLGCTRAGVLLTTFAEETETDLFGEQAVLCGGVSALVRAGFDTLVEAGYQPEVAYFECLHELKLIVDLMYQGGLSYMRYSISDTAEFGDYEAGPRLIDERARVTMRELLTEIRAGMFSERWLKECAAGQPVMARERAAQAGHLIESVGRRLRGMMPFLDPGRNGPDTQATVNRNAP